MFLVLLLSLLASLGGMLHAQVITNGNFETGTAGSAPPSWAVSVGDNGGTPSSVLLGAAGQSPFTSGTQGAILTDANPDGGSRSWTPFMGQTFTAIESGTVSLSFDWSMDSLAYAWNMSFGPSSASTFSLLQLGTSSAQTQMKMLNVGGTAPIYNFATSTWYHVDATIDLDSGLYSLSITPFGGSATTYTDLTYSTNPTTIGWVGFGDGYGTSTNGTWYLDNVAVSAVPEPSSVTLMLGATGVLLGLLRSRRARSLHAA